MKYEVRINPEVLPESTAPDRVLRYIDIGNVDSFGRVLGVEEMRFEDAPSRARRIPRLGDSIIATVRTYLRAIAYISEDDPSMVCSTGFAVVRPGKRLDSKYLFYWLRSDPVVDEICARSVGVSYPAFNGPELGALPVPLVPLDQQRRIADFLDRKTASIDALIEKQEQLLALLAEKRQALITQAVTKGLDPNVPMKDSGVEWLGRIPAHWSVKRLKHVVSRIVDCPHSTPEYEPDGPALVVRTADLDWGRLNLDTMRRCSLATHAARSERMELKVNDILYSREGERLGMAALVPRLASPICLGQRMMAFRVAESGAPGFLAWALNSWAIYRQVTQDILGATSPRVNIPTVANAILAWPPLEEQNQIVAHIEAELRRLDGLVQRIQTMIDKLREYRQALITAAVTGQLDVTPTIHSERRPSPQAEAV
jgi:type I restriction enzyme S subunit